jgi:hypothetical protein
MATDEAKAVLARLGLFLAGAISLFTVENVWLDPWIRAKSHQRMPSFVPESLSGTWVICVFGSGYGFDSGGRVSGSAEQG